MSRPFLTAQWLNLLMANWEVTPETLLPYLPAGTELDAWQGRHYVSLVGFLFADTRVGGIRWPGHVNFPEVNLRFYVRQRTPEGWRRGVVFIKEIVPKPAVTLIANTLFGEKYETRPMQYVIAQQDGTLRVRYAWKVKGEWNYLEAEADAQGQPLLPGSEEEFITEHFWGYARKSPTRTTTYEVAHPRWDIHAVRRFDYNCNVRELYGEAFAPFIQGAPASVFLAAGSEIKVLGKRRV